MLVMNGVVVEEKAGEGDDFIPIILSKYVPLFLDGSDVEYRIHLGKNDGVFDGIIPEMIEKGDGGNDIRVSGLLIDGVDGPYGEYRARISFGDENNPRIIYMNHIDILRPGTVIETKDVVVMQEVKRSFRIANMKLNGKDMPVRKYSLHYLKI